MRPPKLSGEGMPFIRGELKLHPHTHAAVIHPVQFGTVPEAKPDESKPCPSK